MDKEGKVHTTDTHECRHRRGLGPFTGGQLTVLLVAAMLVVGLPVGAYAAVSGQSVFITDHATGAHAQVAASGQLETFAVPPANGFYTDAEQDGTGQQCSFYVVPAKEALVVTGVQFMPAGASGGEAVTSGQDVAEYLDLDTKAGCGGQYSTLAGGAWADDAPEFVSLDPGVAIKAGTRLDFKFQTPTADFFGVVWIYGYLLSTAACGTKCTSLSPGRPVLDLPIR